MQRNSKVFLIVGIILFFVIVSGIFIYNRDIRSLQMSTASPGYYSAGDGFAARDIGLSNQKMAGMPSGVNIENIPPVVPVTTVDNKTTPRLVIKTGTISLVVKDVPGTLEKIKNYAEKIGGFVVQSNTYKSGSAPYGTIVVRIPSTEYESGLGTFKNFGEVVSENTTGQDVTAEYVDLDSQLKNLRAAEGQFLEIMKRAGSISDVLAVQNQLTQVRGQIESIQGRMKFLKESAEMSSVTINLSTDPAALPVVNNDSDSWKPIVVLKDALRGLVEVGKAVANAFIYIVIFLPIWGVAALIVWLVVRRIVRSEKK
jgi:hypothetical protein